ncbi:MAG: 6-phosphogluconolactonase [Gammaproteobacteria bacterium]|nr:6-phosphogluconolactonase [Gammaproteobacteria bacterium]
MNPAPASRQTVRWHLYPDAAALYAGAARAIGRIAREAVSERGAFRVVLAGGATPRALYAQLPAVDTRWSTWHVYFGDERCLPDGHPDRNSTMASETFLNHVPIPSGQIHGIVCAQDATMAAQAYAATLRGIGDFDLVLLGMGEDGHTASLFPGADDWGLQPDGPAALAVEDAPKPPPQRVTLSAARLSAARTVMVLVIGAAKRAAIAAWRSGADLPIGAIRPAPGVDVLLEPQAWGALGP